VKMRAGKLILQQRSFSIYRFEKTSNWGFREFCSISELESHKYPQKDDRIELDYIIRKYPDDFGECGRQNILNPNIVSDLLRAHILLFNDPNTADAQFICSQGTGGHDEYIYAHSITLSTLSEYFKTMFSSGFSEGTDEGQSSPPLISGTDIDQDDQDSDCEDTEDAENCSVETSVSISSFFPSLSRVLPRVRASSL